MNIEKQKKNLALQLFDIQAVKFGEFTTKSGIKTPVYFDLRVIVSYPDVMDLITTLLYETAVKTSDSKHLCGVPYTALPIATLLCVHSRKPMLMRRKEAKAYGTKKMIEGHYKAGESCMIIEDVITSGSSVLETVKDLQNEGLVATEAVIILDREQGGYQNLEANGIKVKSLFTMSELIQTLVDSKKISNEVGLKVNQYLKETKAPAVDVAVDRTVLSFEKRAEMSQNPVAKKLFNIMAAKKTNLCLSVDLTSAEAILNLVEKVGEHICLVKTHVDIIEDFSEQFIARLKQMAEKYNFLIMEDRKFADIGNTVSLQYSKGLYRIDEWADCVTAHSLPGEGVLQGISKAINGVNRGVFLLAEMSCKGNLITADYSEETVKMAAKYPALVCGLVCQRGRLLRDPGLIQLTPGVQLEGATDGLGQVYNTPETVVLENGADVAVVGRGVIAAADPAAQAQLYRRALWRCYEKRVAI